VKNLAHSASFQFKEKIAPSKPGIKHIKRFRRWVKADAFYRMFRALAEDADFEYTMIDGTITKVHRHGQGAKGGL
jgi:transposase